MHLIAIKGNSTLGSEHTVKYTDDVLYNCTLETYIMLLTSFTPINFIQKRISYKHENIGISDANQKTKHSFVLEKVRELLFFNENTI